MLPAVRNQAVRNQAVRNQAVHNQVGEAAVAAGRSPVVAAAGRSREPEEAVVEEVEEVVEVSRPAEHRRR